MRTDDFRKVLRVPTLVGEVGRRLREETQVPEGFVGFLKEARERSRPVWRELVAMGAPEQDEEAFYGVLAAVACAGRDQSLRDALVRRFGDGLSDETLRLLIRGRVGPEAGLSGVVV